MTKNGPLAASIFLAGCVAVSGWSHHASAGLIYDLNCVIKDGCLAEAMVPSYGTVTFADNVSDPSKVDIAVDLVGTSQIVQSLYLNYDDTQFSNSTTFVFSGDVSSGAVDENQQKPDGYPKAFDIQVPATGNFAGDPEPYTFTISLASVNLDPSDFDFKDLLDHIFVAVHIGNCGPNAGTCLPGQTGENSIWVGALDKLTTVPEPGTLSLFAAGLAGLGFMGRRHKLI